MLYRCGVCGSHDELCYLRCDHPGCPDGRDRPYVPQPYDKPPVTQTMWQGFMWGAFCFVPMWGAILYVLYIAFFHHK